MRLELDAADMSALAGMVAELVLAELRPARPSGNPLTSREVAARLGIADRTVRAMTASGRLARVPGTGKVLVPQSEVDRLLAGKAG